MLCNAPLSCGSLHGCRSLPLGEGGPADPGYTTVSAEQAAAGQSAGEGGMDETGEWGPASMQRLGARTVSDAGCPARPVSVPGDHERQTSGMARVYRCCRCMEVDTPFVCFESRPMEVAMPGTWEAKFWMETTLLPRSLIHTYRGTRSTPRPSTSGSERYQRMGAWVPPISTSPIDWIGEDLE